MLVLIGLGLCDEKDITLRGLEEAKEADLVFLERYTSAFFGTPKAALEGLVGKKIQDADRNFVESGKILDYAKKNKAALLIVGDPLAATTHTDLILRAREANINVKVIHNASIITAVADTGLQLYKFGRSVTIPFRETNFAPESFYDVLAENQARGLHTLFFLDIKADESRYMSPQDAIGILEEVEKKRKQKFFTSATKLVVCSRLGSADKSIKYGTVGNLKNENFGGPLHVIIIPGKLHEMEAKFLEMFEVKK